MNDASEPALSSAKGHLREPRLTRVAVVQLAYHPAIRGKGGESPLEDPLFDPRGPSSLLPRGMSTPPTIIQRDLRALRERVRVAYVNQLLARVKAVLSACLSWDVQVVVFPEYSLLHDLLSDVAEAAGDMVVVAGTHSVDRAAIKASVYERLHAPSTPALGQSVCPILHHGALIGLQPKLNQAVPELDFMVPGTSWRPVEIPLETPMKMGVLVCLDFLFHEGAAYRGHVAGAIDDCRLIAVPSLTPTYTLDEFKAKAVEQVKRYRRPVLYCNHADEGGSTCYVLERRWGTAAEFPDLPGVLGPGDEGVVVTDIDLGLAPKGDWTLYDSPGTVIPFAAATLVYSARTSENAYADWLAHLEGMKGEGWRSWTPSRIMCRAMLACFGPFGEARADAGSIASKPRSRPSLGWIESGG